MSASVDKSSSFCSLKRLFAKALLIVFCFFCLNFLFTYFSVARVPGPPAGPDSHGYGLAVARFSSWIDASSFRTWSLLNDVIVSSAAEEDPQALPEQAVRVDEQGSRLDPQASDEEAAAELSASVDRTVSRQTRMTLFELGDVAMTTQLLGVFRNVCYNGSHIITLGSSVVCDSADSEEKSEDGDTQSGAASAAQGSESETPLHPIPCDNAQRLALLKAMLHREHGVPVDGREEEWFFNRRLSATWETGTTSLVYLDRSTANCAHFLGKANFILLMNGATGPGVPGVVQRFYFLLHELREKQWLNTPGNRQGFLATYLAGALNKVLSVFNSAELQSSDILGNHSIVAAQGRVRIGGPPFMAASEDSPLCFERVILPGILKASHYPPGRNVPDVVRQHFKEWLHLEANGAAQPVLLYIRREGLRRVFLRESEHQLALVLRGLEGFYLQNISFTGMSFKEQFMVSQRADVVISLHGANLVNPSMLSRRASILIELQPYRVLHRMYETQSFHSGVIYMSHLLDQGTPQQKDHLFPGLTYWKCMTNPECKEYFVHYRNVEITPADLRQIQVVLAIARRIYLELIRNGVTPDDNETLFEPGLLKIVREENTGADADSQMVVSCAPFLSKKNETCRSTWLSYADHQGRPRICYFAQRCQLAW